jgi:hypothetical protein
MSFFFAFHFCWADAGGRKLLGIQGKQGCVRAYGVPLRSVFEGQDVNQLAANCVALPSV